MKDVKPYLRRRIALAKSMRTGVAIIPTAPERMRNRDSDYPYRFDSYFYYLTGFSEPDSVLVLIAGAKPRAILFCREKNPERELWDGFRCGPAAARKIYGFDEAWPIDALDEKLPQLLANQPSVHFASGADAAWDKRVIDCMNRVRSQTRTGISAPGDIKDIRVILDDMRLIKDAHEIDLMRRAAKISAVAHRRAMRATSPGRMEFEIEAELLHEFRSNGSQFPAYTSIVAGGANACILHYRENSAKLARNDLLLIDAGCELDGYASDITRTFPVSGRFSAAQRDIYELVLKAQAAAIRAVRPGNSWQAPHDAAVRVLVAGFIRLGLCQGSVREVIASGDYRRFYMHRTGHWLGLDVHDAGEYKDGRAWKKLRPGMVLTVEPGCYIRPAKNVPRQYWNIGIRIEDDVLVTKSGCEVITVAAPKSVADIEALMAHA
jgi:Xaa-Pro aminopeptidase